jgi:hypothetical protein
MGDPRFDAWGDGWEQEAPRPATVTVPTRTLAWAIGWSAFAALWLGIALGKLLAGAGL